MCFLLFLAILTGQSTGRLRLVIVDVNALGNNGTYTVTVTYVPPVGVQTVSALNANAPGAYDHDTGIDVQPGGSIQIIASKTLYWNQSPSISSNALGLSSTGQQQCCFLTIRIAPMGVITMNPQNQSISGNQYMNFSTGTVVPHKHICNSCLIRLMLTQTLAVLCFRSDPGDIRRTPGVGLWLQRAQHPVWLNPSRHCLHAAAEQPHPLATE